MQTINLEKNKEESAKGRNGIFKPAQIVIYSLISSEDTTLMFSMCGFSPGRTAPIQILLTKENWKRVLVALGEELGK